MRLRDEPIFIQMCKSLVMLLLASLLTACASSRVANTLLGEGELKVKPEFAKYSERFVF
jgi:major membrane immunogen (membrane-anchored lipoprotein)